MKNRKPIPEIQAGSTADIAFLLLIFFLVSTTFSKDKGIPRTLPQKCPTKECATITKRRNILTLQLNAEGALLINEEKAVFSEATTRIINFVDNNGNGQCTYCKGKKVDSLSESPKKAVLYLNAHPNSEYQDYIKIQNAISNAYLTLRQEMALEVFGKKLENLSKDEMNTVIKNYPLLLSEWQAP